MYNVYKKTSFHLDLWLNDLPFTLTEAGKGSIDVVILDPHGRKDTIRPSISPVPGKEGTYLVEYIAMEQGLHSINIMFAGQQIPKSPYGVNVSPGKRHCWQSVTPVAIVHVVLLLKVSIEFYLIFNHSIVDWNLYLIKQKNNIAVCVIVFANSNQRSLAWTEMIFQQVFCHLTIVHFLQHPMPRCAMLLVEAFSLKELGSMKMLTSRFTPKEQGQLRSKFTSLVQVRYYS